MKTERFHCTVCGRFVPWDADQGVSMGNCTELEPRDPVWYCERCAEENKRAAIAGATWLVSTWYILPEWAAEAMAEIGNVEGRG